MMDLYTQLAISNGIPQDTVKFLAGLSASTLWKIHRALGAEGKRNYMLGVGWIIISKTPVASTQYKANGCHGEYLSMAAYEDWRCDNGRIGRG